MLPIICLWSRYITANTKEVWHWHQLRSVFLHLRNSNFMAPQFQLRAASFCDYKAGYY